MTRESKALILVMYLLISLGLVMIYSASAISSERQYSYVTHYLSRQLVAVAIGTVVFFICSSLNPDLLRRHSRMLVGIAIVLLGLVFVPLIGRAAGGAHRWIRFPFFSFQPVEYAKLAVCVYLADYLARKRQSIVEGSVRIFFAPLLVLGLVTVLVLAQPDLGSCIFLFLVSGVLFFLSGMHLRYILFVAALCVIAFIFLVFAAPYRMSRVAAFLDPWKDPQGSGFQIIQSFLAFGLGGIRGVGLGQGTQKLFYLPQSHTDFIFSIIAEELGLAGTLFVVCLYGLFFLLGVRVIKRCLDSFSQMLALSLVLLVVVQALLNLAVVTGLIPTKGLPLPFVSAGGSALVFHMACVGLVIALDRASLRFSR